MMDYKQDDVWPSKKARKVPFGTWSVAKSGPVFIQVPKEQNLLSPLPVTSRDQENLYENKWGSFVIGIDTAGVGAPGFDWAENTLWRERQQNVAIAGMRSEINSVSQQLAELKQEILRLQSLRTYVVPLTTLSSEFKLKQPIPVTIEGDDESFTATFAEANISASGETESDAIANFKASLVSKYGVLESLPANRLGPLPARQWEILQSVIARTKK